MKAILSLAGSLPCHDSKGKRPTCFWSPPHTSTRRPRTRTPAQTSPLSNSPPSPGRPPPRGPSRCPGAPPSPLCPRARSGPWPARSRDRRSLAAWPPQRQTGPRAPQRNGMPAPAGAKLAHVSSKITVGRGVTHAASVAQAGQRGGVLHAQRYR
eukprot:1195497-Prorocentrum_minimum.AAC.4